MAERRFCERCGAEAHEGELRVVEFAFSTRTPVTLEVCAGCARRIDDYGLGKAGDERREREPGDGRSGVGGEQRRRLARTLATVVAAQAVAAARVLVYLAVAASFFVLVTWLTER